MPNPLTSESLAALLKTFSYDEEEAALAYTKLRGSLVRYFTLKGINETDEAADATIDRVAAKLIQNTQIEDLTRYAFGVARNVFLERIRSAKIQTRAVDRFYLKNDGNRNFAETNYLEQFGECFKSLYDHEQDLLLRYFADLSGEELFKNRQNLADREKVSLNTLRIRVSRLRKRLEDCLREVFLEKK